MRENFVPSACSTIWNKKKSGPSWIILDITHLIWYFLSDQMTRTWYNKYNNNSAIV